MKKPPAPRTLPDPWWSGFGDPMLGALVASARWNAADAPSTPPLETQVAAAWASAKSDIVALDLIADPQFAMRRQCELLYAWKLGSELVAPRLAMLAQRRDEAEQTARAISRRRDTAINLLACLCGQTADAVERMIVSTPDELRIPRFLGHLPLANADVLMALPNGRTETRAIRNTLAGMHVENQRREALSHEAVETCGTFHRLVASVRMDAADEFEALERYQQLILLSRQLAAIDGALALSWVALVNLLGESRPARRHTALWTCFAP